MRRAISLLLFLVLLSGCSSNDVNCDTGPVGFDFEIVNEDTGENLFLNGLDEENQLYIENSAGETVEFNFDTERSVFSLSLGWDSKSDNYTVTVGEDLEFNIVFTLEKSSSRGCSSTQLRELEIVGASYETSNTTGITTIFVSNESNWDQNQN